jgi:ubiquinone/menaquinone biosynthesis C-methylase UbiE
MAHIFNGDFSRLESDKRKKILPAKEILELIGIQKGDTIIDYGAGIGYFAIPALEYVGEKGKVIAVDISGEMIKELRKRAGDRPNIEILEGDSIPDEKADIILLVNVLHELDFPGEFLNQCFTHLLMHGRVIVIDWQKKVTEMGPPVDHRISKEEVIALANRKPTEHKIHRFMYFLEFR